MKHKFSQIHTINVIHYSLTIQPLDTQLIQNNEHTVIDKHT